MIIEMYIMFEVLILMLILLGWFRGHIMFWGLGFVFSAIQIFTSYNIEYVVFVYDTVLTTHVKSIDYAILSYINMIFLAICIVMFFWDMFNPRNQALENRGEF